MIILQGTRGRGRTWRAAYRCCMGVARSWPPSSVFSCLAVTAPIHLHYRVGCLLRHSGPAVGTGAVGSPVSMTRTTITTSALFTTKKDGRAVRLNTD